MRILQLSDFYPPVVGGLELLVQTLSQELCSRGHQVMSISLGRSAGPDGIETDNGVQVHRVLGWNAVLLRSYADSQRPFHFSAPDPGVSRQLRRVLQTFQPDVVHAHGWPALSYLAMPRPNPPLLLHLHDYSYLCPRKTLLTSAGKICGGPGFRCLPCAAEQYGAGRAMALSTGLLASQPLLRRVRAAIAVSSFVAKRNAELTWLPPGRIKVIPAFIPDVTIKQVRDAVRPEFLPEGPYLLFVGALGRHKGLHDLLAAFRTLGDLGLSLVLIGTRQPDTPSLDYPGVRVVYDVSGAEVMAAWAHACVGVVPSAWPEPRGLVAAEAFVAGCPIVATAVGGLAETVVDGVNGLLVPPEEPMALAGAIRRLVLDVNLRSKLSAAARTSVGPYLASNAVSAVEELYDQMVESNASS